MRAMILAAGRGERLRPLTDRLPKPMAPIGGRPLLAHQLEWLARAGFTEVVINLHHLGHLIEQAFGDGRGFGVRIIYSREAEKLETGGGIAQALPHLGAAPFLVLNGDIYTDFPLARLHDALPADADAHLVLTPTPAQRDRGDFDWSKGRVTARGTRYVYCGIAVLRPELFVGRPVAPFSLRDLLFDAQERDRLSGEIWEGYWTDIGTARELAAVDAVVRQAGN